MKLMGCSARSINILSPSATLGSAFLVGISLGGCSLNPIQQDVTGFPTKEIVDHIRCEVKYAVLDKAIGKLESRIHALRHDQIDGKPAPSTPPTVQEVKIAGALEVIVKNLHSQREEGGVINFNPNTLPTPQAITFYNLFINTGVAYDFTFDISVMNSASLAIDPVRLISNGTAGFTVGTGANLTRSNTRRFQLSDTFSELLTNKDLECGRRPLRPGNFVYPVAGRLGLDELINTFVDLAEGQLLQKNSSGAVFGDTLKFTTVINGGVTPHVLINPVGSRFGFAAPATLGLNATRTDIHTMIISLSMGAEGAATYFGTARVAASGRIVPLLPNSSANVSVAKQNVEIQRDRTLQDSVNNALGR